MQYPAALSRILRPLVRSMIARGMTFTDLSDLLKKVFIERAQTDFGLQGKRMTDSRISLLTGLQRRDVKLHRTDETPPDLLGESTGPLPRVLARWLTDKTWCKRDGTPRPLTRIGEGRSFEALVASISRDMHSRTLLDELLRQGTVEIDAKGRVVLIARSYTPSGDDAMLDYFGANLGDHAEAASANLLASPDPAPFFERAVHYNQLSDSSVAELDALARQLQDEALLKLNAEALRLQQADANDTNARGRFRCGAFVYVESGAAVDERKETDA